MNVLERADEAAYRLNNTHLTAVEEIQNLEILQVALEALSEDTVKDEHVTAFKSHANPRTFLVACHQGKFTLARLIHETASIKLNGLVTKEGFSPMHMAASAGDLEFIKYLELHKVAIDGEAVTPKGWTPLHSACLKGHEACITYLLEHGADAKKTAGPKNQSPAQLVEASKNSAAIQALAKARLLNK